MTNTLFESYEIRRIIDERDISTYYQPIVKLDYGDIIGYEALSRGPIDSILHSPVALLNAAENNDMLWELELIFRSLAIEHASGLGEGQFLFLNVDPNIIRDPKFEKGLTKDYLHKFGVSPDKIIFEITERTAIDDYDTFKKILNYYTNQGYKIAIDDAGAGYSGMNTIVETKPGFVKIDMNIVRNIHKDSFKQAIVKSFVQLGASTNIKIIAEGIETKEELKTLIRLGVYAGQGYYFQRPASKLLNISESIISSLSRYHQQVENNGNYNSSYHFIGPIADSILAVRPSAKGQELVDIFSDVQIEGVCVTSDGFVDGLITKQAFYQTLASQYGHALYMNRPVSLLMDEVPLIVDYYTPINKVAELATARENDHIYDTIIVTQGTKYYGIVTVKNLLQYAIQLERDHAKESNPLTGLPGNLIINRVLNDVISYKTQCVILYFDLDNFKAYNDVYGFDNGDKIIKTTAQIIQDTIKQKDSINTFVGHIGGDDFVAVLDTSDFEKVCDMVHEIIITFDNKIVEYYNENDRKNGYILTEDRFGEAKYYEMTSLSIAGLYGVLSPLGTTEKLSAEMAKLKKVVKKIPGSVCEIFPISAESKESPCNVYKVNFNRKATGYISEPRRKAFL
ncbi:GGDEF domain-containing protein [Fusibacter sp. JL216-2]|uniref:GGDEF domain-containing protein n=1 Tax=Fusibacter sp. JL216-2 TaxID=3071453 RepID=UPI003D34AAB9